MRVLFTVQPSTGHLHPLIPVARALTDAGHDVAVCSAASFASQIVAFGLTPIAAGLDWLAGEHSTWTAFPPMPPPGPAFAEFVVTVFADITAARMAPDVIEIAREWRPDLIIRESMEYGGCLAAEVLGLPHASVAGNGYSAVDSPDVGYFPGNRLRVAAPMARHRQALGLPADPDNLMPFRHLHLCFMPPEWDGEATPCPPHSAFLRHDNASTPGVPFPSYWADLPDRPTVLASLGTVFNSTPGVLEAIIAALGSLDVNAVVAIGPEQDAARFGELPPNVQVADYLPQAELLPSCAAFVTHGGFNSIKESLIAGIPMVVIPITADQPYCAQRAAALGTARVVAPDNREPAEISNAVSDVLTDRSYRDAARSFQHRMRALPGHGL
jgi:UDP:flavonoid glycosyltransferase YjiC (YdhE family)